MGRWEGVEEVRRIELRGASGGTLMRRIMENKNGHTFARENRNHKTLEK